MALMLTGEIFGLPILDADPVFAIALAVHIGCGLTAVIAGALAATAKKRRGRHPRAGHVYLWTLGGIFTTATIMAAIRWREDAQPADDTDSDGHPTTPSAWAAPTSPASPASTSTRPLPPPLDQLPHWTYWLLPSLVGIPLIWLALHRFTRSTPDKPSRTPAHII